ncbi:hypothetical protein FNF27_00508 [Cafeteria roenbergensis]|uniref:Uncharacterized protein n=1 Tax=Cafeteria roenbergensis TaxID=33653 RepID=A0A5A8E7L0_CAFRO|nr:hypothetical protein FNF29_00186 [Cafeteria roenbergensis]KAA0165544.1 hypothetical protein FNF31_01889 [Cafeteria roenbergensis]KAA0172030.1 hypothetical protein FNF28_00347 [Cafeteria roenbergensis]KAA0177960.1 hypothetical protein FNF27_00508 [Cafeteria roenbergensis]|eukprot:KAA0157610.1 hypothetical protein FNF29_00186 [Cafeteria roenbergensis]
METGDGPAPVAEGSIAADVEMTESNIADALEIAAAMADALAGIDSKAAKRASSNNVDFIEAVDFIRVKLHAAIEASFAPAVAGGAAPAAQA